MKYNMLLIIIAFISFIGNGCNKSSFLSSKPDLTLIIPETLDNFKAIIDNDIFLNGTGTQGVNPAFGEAASDDYYLFNSNLSSVFKEGHKNLYVWNDNIYTDPKYDWAYPYRAIFYSNVVLEGLNKIKNEGGNAEYDNLKGSALFFRAEMFYQLAQVFAPPYDKNTEQNDWGIVLKLSPDINEPVNRATVQETYKRIVGDLKTAEELLPALPLNGLLTRPSKSAVYALLARVYLTTQQYDSALKYSNKCLKIKGDILDYNDNTIVNKNSSPGFKKAFNPEVIFHSRFIISGISGLIFSQSRLRVDSTLYDSYHENDLRKKVFYSKQAIGATFKGSYDGSGALFGGIATDEVFFIKSECEARLGFRTAALETLNMLMAKRWDNSVVFQPIEANDDEEAIRLILIERRKELVFRGLRWTDLRRLNKQGANIVLRRVINGQEYVLLPNDPRYTFLIPPDVISVNPGMPQNRR